MARKDKAQSSKQQQAGSETKKATDLDTLRLKITEMVAGRALAITQAALDDAEEEVNIAAMKYLFELIGLYPPRMSEEQDQQKPDLVATLITKLGLPAEPMVGEESGNKDVKMVGG